MKVKPLSDAITADLRKYNLKKPFDKQLRFLEQQGTTYPSLNFELVQATKKYKDPRRRVYSFRVSGKYRAYFIKPGPESLEILLVDPHKYPF